MGSDYSNIYISKPSPDLCKQICAVDEQCQAFTYVRPGLEGGIGVISRMACRRQV
ncbi:MAG TPA: hypothetical protein DCS91_00060 [Microcoleaceae bacterium UBA11344]|nr:hypothetical protein [Microcoleaceae cyanobacterium UBA11344]